MKELKQSPARGAIVSSQRREFGFMVCPVTGAGVRLLSLVSPESRGGERALPVIVFITSDSRLVHSGQFYRTPVFSVA